MGVKVIEALLPKRHWRHIAPDKALKRHGPTRQYIRKAEPIAQCTNEHIHIHTHYTRLRTYKHARTHTLHMRTHTYATHTYL
jgi:hypothetical protein